MAAAVIAVGKMRQARGEKWQRRRRRRRRRQRWCGSGSDGPWGEARGERAGFHGSCEKLTPERRFEWQEGNYVSISMSRSHPRPGHSKRKHSFLYACQTATQPFGGGKGMFFMFLYFHERACGYGLRQILAGTQ